MNQLIVVIDESTSQINQSKNTSEVGVSLAFWVAYLYDPENEKHPTVLSIPEEKRHEVAVLMKTSDLKPVRSGSIYNDFDTPIKICLDGILRALEACKYLIDKHSVNELILISDCKPAIELIEKETTAQAVAIKSLCNQIGEALKEYTNKSCDVKLHYVSENDFQLFKEIDGIAKNFRGTIDKTFN